MDALVDGRFTAWACVLVHRQLRSINNLASLLSITGRMEEAEILYAEVAGRQEQTSFTCRACRSVWIMPLRIV